MTIRKTLRLVWVALSVLVTAQAAHAAPTPSVLASGSSSTDTAADFTTGTASPTANRLQLLLIHHVETTTAAAISSVTGCSMTWAEVTNYAYNTSSRRISIWRTMSATPGSACALTIATGTRTGIAYLWTEWTELDTSGSDGSGAIVTSTSGTNTASGTSLNNTFATFGSESNAGVEVCVSNVNGNVYTVDATATWTQIGTSQAHASPASTTAVQYRIGTDTTATCTFTTNGGIAAIGVELKAAAAATSSGGIPRLLGGIR